MKDKEKIEEMAKEIFNTCAWRFGKPNDYKEIFNDIAEDLIKLNYRKIPKDSVVIPDKITEETSAEDLIKIAKYNDKIRKIERKETAEKIINWIDTYYPCYSRADLIKELEKQFSVEIKE